MRVLWFSPIPLLDPSKGVSHNGGGWISSLMQIVRCYNNIELGIAFNLHSDTPRNVSGGVTYYSMPKAKKSFLEKVFHRPPKNEKIVEPYLRVIEDYKPNIIQVFGSETDHGLICKYTRIPVVIHIQGCLPPYYNALFPVRMNKYDFWFERGLDIHFRIMGIRSESAFKKNAEREIGIIQSCRYFMGRTDWDAGLIRLMNPTARYFHCEEALRDAFLNIKQKWEWHDRKHKKIVSVISTPWYKGVDLILKTAQLLRRFTNLDFEWRVYGVRTIGFYENKYGIKAADVNVNIMGVASMVDLVDALTNAS